MMEARLVSASVMGYGARHPHALFFSLSPSLSEWDIETGKCLKTFKLGPILDTRINDTYIVSSCRERLGQSVAHGHGPAGKGEGVGTGRTRGEGLGMGTGERSAAGEEAGGH